MTMSAFGVEDNRLSKSVAGAALSNARKYRTAATSANAVGQDAHVAAGRAAFGRTAPGAHRAAAGEGGHRASWLQTAGRNAKDAAKEGSKKLKPIAATPDGLRLSTAGKVYAGSGIGLTGGGVVYPAVTRKKKN